jgi:metal-responsive CopG/Arc/MetJ family transcriptional regulator
MKNTKYITVKIPEGLADKIDEIMENDTDFTSRTDVLKDCVRRRYDEMKQQVKK